MENKQTAVEWAEDELSKLFIAVANMEITYPEYHKKRVWIWEQAKVMEKEQEHETKQYWFGRGIRATKEDKIKELKPIKDNGKDN